MKTMAIVNPDSGKGATGKAWTRIQAAIETAIGGFETVITTGPEEATSLAREALLKGFDRIIAVGGDGTLNEVVNGFFADGRPVRDDAALSVIMSGTGGDFRKTLALSGDYEEAAQALAAGEARRVDVGRISFVGHDGSERTRHFINIASLGMSGDIDMRVNRSKFAGLIGGRAAFALATLQTLAVYQNKSVRLKIDGDRNYDLKVRLAAIANGRFAGGGMMIAPEAAIDDGLFDVVILGDVGRARVLTHMSRIYQGTHVLVPGVITFRARRIEALSDDKVLLDVDGEAPGRLPAVFEIMEGAISLI